MGLNRHDRRAARAVNEHVIRMLGQCVQIRDRARDALAEVEAVVQAERLAGRATLAMETRLTGVRAALASAEVELSAARAEAAMRDTEISAETMSAAIHQHLTEIGLDAVHP